MTLMQREGDGTGSGAPATGESPVFQSRLPVGETANQEKRTFELTRISDLISKALKGELPREREPRYWEPQILTAAHINMVMDRAAGFSVVEIGARWEYTPQQVSNVLASPDAQTILSTILSIQAEKLTDIDSRLKAMVPEALNVKVQILRDTAVSAAVRDRVASDILDRAGYAPKQKLDISHDHRILMPAQAATGLKNALEASQRVALVDYTRHLQKPDAEVAASHLQVTEVGHLEPVGGASPAQVDGSLDGVRVERVA